MEEARTYLGSLFAMKQTETSHHERQEQLRHKYARPKYWPQVKIVQNDAIYGNHVIAKCDMEEDTMFAFDATLIHVTIKPDTCAECGRAFSDPLVVEKRGVECAHHRQHGISACPHRYCSASCRDWAWLHYHDVQDPVQLAELTQACVSMTKAAHSRTQPLAICKLLAMYAHPVENAETIRFIESLLFQTTESCIARTVSTLVARMDMQLLQERFDVVTAVLGDDCPTDIIGTPEFLEKITALFCIYPFGTGKGESMCLSGPLGYFNHSCEPNAAMGFIGGDQMVAAVKTLRPIRKGEQIFLSYLPNGHAYPVRVRRHILQAQYGFTCECRCCRKDAEESCDGCGKSSAGGKNKLMICTRCRKARYCNRQCQAADWKKHKVFCNKTGRYSDVDTLLAGSKKDSA